MVKSGEAIRSSVALALVKLLKLLPQEATKAALPRALQGVANLLRNRLQRIRHVSYDPTLLLESLVKAFENITTVWELLGDLDSVAL